MSNKHSSLLCPIISHIKNKELRIWPRSYIFLTLHFLAILQMGPISKSLSLHNPGKVTRDNPFSLLDTNVRYEENKVFRLQPLVEEMIC